MWRFARAELRFMKLDFEPRVGCALEHGAGFAPER